MTQPTDETSAAVESWSAIAPGLDRDLMELSLRLRRLEKVRNQLLKEVVNRLGLNVVGDYEVLALLRRHGGQLRPQQVAKALRITASGLTGRLDRLARQALITRTAAVDDRRSVRIHLTEAGTTCAEAAFEQIQDAETQLLAPLTEAECRHIRLGLERVLRTWDPLTR